MTAKRTKTISDTKHDLTVALLGEAERKTPDLLTMKSLIDAGADVNGRNDAHRTVLMQAVSRQNKDAAALLIDNGADMYARDKGEPTANVIFYAISRYDTDMVRMFLGRKFDPNLGTCRGNMTALMWAANFKKKDLCEVLAYGGANINAKNPENGWTAMDYADDNLKYHISERLREIDKENKERAVREAAEEKARAEQAERDKANQAFDAVCEAGLPIEKNVKLMKPLMYKPPGMRR